MYPPLSGLFDSRPVTCVPTATIEGWKSDPGRIFRPCTDCFLVFSSPLFPSNSLGGNANFQILFPLSLFLFLRSMFRARNFRNSSIALDEDWFRTLCKLFFFFCEKFEKFKKRFFESIFLPYNIWISQKYFQIFSRGNLLKSVFSTESLRVEFPIERYSNYIYMVYKTHGYYREDLWIRDSTNIAANFKAN